MTTRLSKLAALQKQQARNEAKIADLKRAVAVAAKRDDSRRKFVLGAAMSDAVDKKLVPAEQVRKLLDHLLTRPSDRALFATDPLSLLPVRQQPTPPAASPTE